MKSLVAALSIIGLSLTGLSASTAAEAPSLTFEEFSASANYQDYVAANLANTAYLKDQEGITYDVLLLMSVPEGDPVPTTMKIESDKKNSRVYITSGELVMNIVMIGTSAYADQITYNTYYGPENRNQVFNRIGNTSGKSIKLKSIPEEVASFSPANMLADPSAVQTEILQSQFANLASSFKFSEMVKSVNPDDETKTDYSFSFSLDIALASITIDMLSTFDANSMLVKSVIHMSTVSGAFNQTSDMVMQTSITPDLVITAPASVIDEKNIIRTSHQLVAEEKSATKAAAISKKATVLAKKAKKPVSAAHLQAAATALKYKVTKLSNGVKLTATESGVKGSLCVTVNKGKTSTKNC